MASRLHYSESQISIQDSLIECSTFQLEKYELWRYRSSSYHLSHLDFKHWRRFGDLSWNIHIKTTGDLVISTQLFSLFNFFFLLWCLCFDYFIHMVSYFIFFSVYLYAIIPSFSHLCFADRQCVKALSTTTAAGKKLWIRPVFGLFALRFSCCC